MKNSRSRNKFSLYRLLGMATLVLLTLQLLLVLVSWLVTAADPQAPVHSLLSAEGVRWFVGHLTSNLQTPALIWLMLVAVSGGTLARAVTAYRQSPSRPAMRVVAVELVLFLVVALLLTAVPHAMLLSVTGSLFPSSFSDGLLAMICLVVMVCSITYCMVSRQVRTIAEAYETLCYGTKFFGVIVPLYVAGAQFLSSLLYVLGY